MRGVLHHLPEYKESIAQIITAFNNSNSSNLKLLFLIANPNSESLVYKKFGRLPALECGTDFASIYKVHGGREMLRELIERGFVGHLHYPYLRTPYAKPLMDFVSFAKSFVTGKFAPFPFPRNIFNLVAEFVD